MSDTRDNALRRFLQNTGWAEAARHALAGDASSRRYERLARPDGAAAVLMDAPPHKGEDIAPFIAIDTHLRQLGLSAPAIFGEDRENGFLLLEDLGDALFARVAQTDPGIEPEIYGAAVDLLADLHTHPAPAGIARYDAGLMTTLSALAFDWYLPAAKAEDAPAKAVLSAMFEPLLTEIATTPDVLILRDYHAENLLWLPERQGLARVGLLDFQDAMAGHRAYDLVSLLEDARRDVPADLRQALFDRYVARTGQDPQAFATAAAVIAAQRNLRIVGVFARLCCRDGKPGYVDLLPRVWAHLMADLAHPALHKVRELVLTHLPPPDETVRNRIKGACAKLQTR
ncbi:aminoglycoside phosphotransferase family protein [Actibacterium ureilyticum]|uniref:aminoglycoside phosphotransferase family protein n=1 Tax=Actibacterium ureilyticum TaxID=1590614 RepID=UPI000BAB1D16|nr:phosphotransferase [Actibacterium ureilyticum]